MVDALCFDDLDRYGTELDDPVAELEQDIYHRLIEPPGSNPDDPDRGLGIQQMLSGPADSSWASRIEAEMRKDDRVEDVNVTIAQLDDGSNAGASFRVDIDIEPDGDITVLLDNDGVRRVA